MSPPEVNPHGLLRYSLTLLSRRDSHPVISRNPGPLRIADLAGLLGDRADPSQVPSQTRVMTRLLPIIPRAVDTEQDRASPRRRVAVLRVPRSTGLGHNSSEQRPASSYYCYTERCPESSD